MQRFAFFAFTQLSGVLFIHFFFDDDLVKLNSVEGRIEKAKFADMHVYIKIWHEHFMRREG